MSRVLITGGAGFLGRALVRELFEENAEIKTEEIRVLDLEPENPFPELPVSYHFGDIRDKKLLLRLSKGVDVIFHLASLVDWGTHSKREVYDINVEGSRNVIEAAKANSVNILIHLSSEDAVYTGKAMCNIDEDQPYPLRFPNAYCESKAESEKLVLNANSKDLKTVVFRPGDMYGEGDPYHISALLEMAEGWPYVRIGNGTALCQHIYVGNVASALLQAASNIENDNTRPCGEVYFLSDSPPSNFFHFFDKIVEDSGYTIRPKNLYIPAPIMLILGYLFETVAFLLRPIVRINPKVSRFAVWYTCNNFTFSSAKAEQDFGYSPKYDEVLALKRTCDYFRQFGPVRKRDGKKRLWRLAMWPIFQITKYLS